jgi:hypothetical protein
VSPSISPKIRVLFLAANPVGTPQLRLDGELREITAKIRAAEYRDSLELISRWAVRPDDLQQALLEHRPHIVHFSGHGSGAEGIILEADSGKPKPVSNAALVSLFRTLKDNVRVVLFNACYARAQAEAVIQVIDCAIGMKQAIGDQAAITFAASFYRALGFGRSVQEGFDLGRTALLLEGIPEENTPELLMRSGVDPATMVLAGAPERRSIHQPLPVHKDSKTAVCGRLVHDWPNLADYFEIPLADRAGFKPGREPHSVWEWLEQRARLGELHSGLAAIGRSDLTELLSKDETNG